VYFCLVIASLFTGAQYLLITHINSQEIHNSYLFRRYISKEIIIRSEYLLIRTYYLLIAHMNPNQEIHNS